MVYKPLIWLAIIVLILGWNLWPYAFAGYFEFSIALGFLLLFGSVFKTGTAGRIGFWCAMNNMVDEVGSMMNEKLFDPTQFGLNEIVFVTVVIIIETWLAIRAMKKRSSG